ncbi:hypothetical protein L3Q82_018259 [Scortum barcoo]|uniref:Uncharacterized protein n=1 Tax=Scortum barcoo TaxID=214431 RepID=A0ACB8VLL4_9TELE|nr:hypothetical protein L3Q82_018259 [Scortum barcoo]
MGPGRKENRTGGSKCFIFLLLNIGSFVVSVTAFSLRTCRISYDTAICVNSTAVPQDIPSSVKGLDLSVNLITRINESDFKRLPLLTKLDLHGNNISHIDKGAFASLGSLNFLNLNNNSLVTLGDDFFDGLSNLTELVIHDNRITAVSSTSFKSLTSLKLLDLAYNKLRQLTKVHCILQQLPNLQILSIKQNYLTTFQSWELTNSSLELKQLDLSHNPISVFSITADVFPKLTWLNIGYLKPQMKWDVRNKTFLRQVSTLDISGLHMAVADMKPLLESFNSSLMTVRMNSMKVRIPAVINITCTIPTVTRLQLQKNKFQFVRSDLFQLCTNLTELDLGGNAIETIENNAFRSLKGLKILSLGRNKLKSVPAAIRNLTTLEELDLSSNQIRSLTCHDFTNLTKLRHLSLYQNSIPTLQGCVFKDLIRLQFLKLQTSHISDLKDAFQKHLPNLIQLQLNGNKLTTIKKGDFSGLRSLQNLSLYNNEIKIIEKECFSGLTSLTTILLQSNGITEKGINNGSFNDLTNLRRLDLRDNHIHYVDDSALTDPPFSDLSLLDTLALLGQHHRGKAQLPRNILQGLTNLTVFYARNMQLISLHEDTFKYAPQLQTLDLSSNDIENLTPDLFSPIGGLKSLYISRLTLQSLDFFMKSNLTKLEFLQARKNAYSVISEDVVKSLPALVYLDLKYNSFTCDCDNLWFLQWAENNNQTQVFDAYSFMCNYPRELAGVKLLDFDVRSCSVELDFVCFVSTTCVTLLFMVVSFTYHFLRWQLVYAYYFFLALLFDTKHKNKQAPNKYDAFISYNTHDEQWVIEELLPKLEDEQGWKLCLHHRDFEPGKPIIDNITESIYGSRKTICVISHKYLESEWCSREIQVASFRLFDEQKDVLILVFLEEIPCYLLSPYYRMKKMMKKRTYLSWPRAGEHTGLFWEKLHQALRTGEDAEEDGFLLSRMNIP